MLQGVSGGLNPWDGDNCQCISRASSVVNDYSFIDQVSNGAQKTKIYFIYKFNMDPLTIKTVLAIGPGGNVGRSTIKALLDEKFKVTGLSRTSSEATLPSGVKHVKSDYSET